MNILQMTFLYTFKFGTKPKAGWGNTAQCERLSRKLLTLGSIFNRPNSSTK